MINAEFFKSVLPTHVSDKEKVSAEGVVTVEIHLKGGGRFTLASVVDFGDSALVVDVYSEGALPVKRSPEPDKGGTPSDLDRIAFAYDNISHVVITTKRARKEIGYLKRG